MESLQEIYDRYAMNKEENNGGTDKGHWHSYIGPYGDLFAGRRTSVTTMLEIGILHGSSMLMWRDYFPNADVYGLDAMELPLVPQYDGIRMARIIADSTDKQALDENLASLKFDIIIDDGSHRCEDQIITFNYLFGRLKPAGIYVIEDIADIDRDWRVLQSLGGGAQIIDLRAMKGRFDDILVVVRKQ